MLRSKKRLPGSPLPHPSTVSPPSSAFSWAGRQIWAANLRPEFARLQAKTNEHPLDKFRGNGPLSNIPAFAKAFGCAADSKMVRPAEQRCRIW